MLSASVFYYNIDGTINIYCIRREYMKKFFKRFLCSILTAALTLSAVSAAPATSVCAKEGTGSGLVLSADTLTVPDGAVTTFTAILEEGADASRLDCIVADPGIVTVTPTAYSANAAAYQVNYVDAGSTVIAVYHTDNPAVVAYITVNTCPLTMDIPARLGTNRDNYCTLVDYTFEPYDFTYMDLNDYRYILNLRYQLASYKDEDFNKWGCYGYFHDAAGNVLSKVHLYCSSLSKGRIYHSEFNVPVDAVSFTIEGF